MNNSFRLSDDSDFLPIIPINENDADQDRDLVIPDNIIILPLRNTVLFPGIVLPITVSRDKSIKAVNDCYKGDKLIGVVAQKDITVEEPTIADLHNIGTVAKIVKLIKMPDGSTTIIIQGKKRFAITDFTAEDPYFKANVKLLGEDIVTNDDNFDAYISSIKDLATQIIELSPNIPSEAAIILKNIESPLFLINFVSTNLHNELGKKQELLETDNLKIRAEQLTMLLQNDLQFAELKDKVTNKTRSEIDKQQR